jgi:hypothetical protein
MRTTVQITTPGFAGSFACTVEKEEWKTFVEALRHLEASIGKDAEASWGNMEENIEFHFRLDKRGALEGQYKFSPENFSIGPALSGAFEADQTFLQGWVQSAQQVLKNAR